MARINSLLIGFVFAALALIGEQALAQEVLPAGKWTVIIHGRESGTIVIDPCGYPGTYDDLTAEVADPNWANWMRRLAGTIEASSTTPVNIYKMSASTLQLTPVNDGTTPDDETRHHVLMFDWAQTSGIMENPPLIPIFCDVYTGGDDGFAYAAGEAAYATLRSAKADQKVFAIIGYSRGAVVASELTKRLISAGHDPHQIIFLDGEGCNNDPGCLSGRASCGEYDDGTFDAWSSAAGTSIRYDNIYETLDEVYIAPTICSDGATDLGGHCRPHCWNHSLLDIYAHTPWLNNAFYCINRPVYPQAGIWEYLVSYLHLSGGLFSFADEPNAPTGEPNTISNLQPWLFNGDFETRSIAGWYGNGGGGAESNPDSGGTIEQFGGSWGLKLFQGRSHSHSYFAMPGCASTISFDAATTSPGGSNINNELILALYRPDLGEVALSPHIAATGLTGSLQHFGPYAVPQDFLGRPCSLMLIHTNGGGFNADVRIDNVSLVPTGVGPPNPPNPTIQGTTCSGFTLARAGSPPPGVTWFWEESSNGTRLDLGSDPTFTPTSNSLYYIRARCDVTGTWSVGAGFAQYIACDLPADLNCDGAVDLTDLVTVLSHYGKQVGAIRADGDLDGDGDVDFSDLVEELAHYGEACTNTPPSGMVLVPAGEFLMGNAFSGEGNADELPRHAVQLDAFYMDVYEVTNAQYALALNWAWSQGGQITVTNGIVYKYNTGTSYPYCKTTGNSSTSRITWNGTTFGVTTDKENHPMAEVSWYGAAAYCNWRSAMEGRPPCYDLATWACAFDTPGVRLPTEAEWEKAARGGAAGRRFPWSDQDTIQHARCNYYSSHVESYDTSPTSGYFPLWAAGTAPYTSPVGFFDGSLQLRTDWGWPDSATSYQTANGANDYGLYDMAGNVWEWCNDWYSSTYYSNSPPYENPRGPSTGSERVYRGGSLENGGFAFWARSAARSHGTLGSGSWFRDRGFRCAAGTQ